MKSTGGAKETRSRYLGVFTLAGNNINGRPHYVNNKGKHMFWLEDEVSAEWLVSET